MQGVTTVDLPFGRVTKWYATYVDSCGHIFCQLSEPSISVKYERLYQGINSWARAGKLQLIPIDPAIGEVCLAKAGDGSWYRCQVTEVDVDSRQADVFYFDYGNSEVVSFDCISQLPPPFSDLPPQANECVLANVEPVLHNDKWSERALELIKELVLEQELHGIAIKLYRNVLVLKLFADHEGTVTVAEQLISAGFGQVKHSRSISSSSGSAVRSGSISSAGSAGSKKNSLTGAARSLKQYKRTALNPEQYIDFSVVYCENLNKFFCQFVASKNDLDKLQENLQVLYRNESSEVIMKSVKLNQPCCAKFSEDDMWYRGIVKTINSTSATIYFVDYGNTDLVNQTDLREIKTELLSLPICAVECSLSGVLPLAGEKTYSDKAKEKFETLTMDNSSMVGLVTKVTNNKIEVILYDSNDSPINQKLVEEGLVAAVGQPEANLASLQSQSSQSMPEEEASNQFIKYVPQVISTGFEALVYVSYMYNPHNFYVSLVQSTNSLDQLMADIRSVYQDSVNTKGIINPVVDQPCAVKFSEDNQYYRGVITELKSHMVKVHYVDYGNSEDIAVGLLQNLRKEFIKLPKQAIPCKLDGIEPINEEFHADACRKFEELTLDKNITMTVIGLQDGVHLVRLEEINHNNVVPKIDIAQALILGGMGKEGGMPTKKRNFGAKITSSTTRYKDLKIDINTYIDVSPVDVLNPSQFCCHVVQNAVEFKQLTKEINEFYDSSVADSQVKWEKLVPCVALYDVDKCWYRATVTSIVTNTTVEVSFVDFGNTEVINIQNIRPIYEGFMVLPAQVFVCSLADVIPVNKFWTSEAVKYFQNLVIDKHLAANIKSKNENNSYSIVLYDTKNSPEVNISQSLIKNGYASSTEATVATLGCEKYVDPNDVEQVLVTCVTNPSNFWLQLSRLGGQLDQMMTQIETFYTNLNQQDLSIASPMIGQYCCAKFTEDDGWYRAAIEEVNGSTVTVRYIDYGNSENIDIGRIKVLDTDFDSLPKFALHCGLAEMKNFLDWDLSLNSLLLDKGFEAKFSTNESSPLLVHLKSDGKSVNGEIAVLIGLQPDKKIYDKTPCNLTTPPFIVGKSYGMYFLHEATPKTFYCQLVEGEESLNNLMDDIAVYMDSRGVSACDDVNVGSYCLACYSEDGKWYRAQIAAVMGNNITIYFCDYGNKEVISSMEKISSLPERFCSLPMQVVECSTQSLQSGGKMKDFLSSIDIEQVLNTRIIELNSEGYIVVDICNVSDNNQPTHETTLCKPEPEETNTNVPAKSRQQKLEFKCTDLESNEPGICTFISSPIQINVQLNKYGDKLTTIMDELATYCETAPQLVNLEPSLACAAKYVMDDAWYRAEILNINADKVMVNFVDYGNTEEVPANSLKQLTAPLASLPKTSVSFTLHDVHAEDVDFSKAKLWLEENVLDQSVDVKVISKSETAVEANVYITGSEGHVNDALYTFCAATEFSASENLVSNKDEVTQKLQAKSPVVEKEEKSAITHKIPQQEEKKRLISCPKFAANTNTNAFCYVVESPVVLRCQLSQYQEQLDDLMNHIAAVADSSPVLNAPETNDICLAKYSADEGWYRGRIVNVDDGITVEFVDFGNQEKVDAQGIRSLSAEFAILPQTCVKVILNDVHLEDIDTAATITWLQEKVLEHVLRLEVVNVEDQATISAYVYIEGQDEHVNDKIYELHALQVTEEVVAVNENVVESSPPVQDTRTSSSPNTNVVAQTAVKTTPCKYKSHAINNNDTVPVICTFVSSATEIQVQLFQYTMQLDELMEKIASYCSQKTVTPNNLAVGTPYLGLYPDDGEWYRAEISDIDGENITLNYIDYGNTAIVTAKDVRNITEEFLSLPRTCVTCKLHDVHVEDIDVKKSQEFLETYLNQELTLSVSIVENEQTISGFVSVPNGKVSLNDMLYEKFSLPEVVVEEEKSAEPEKSSQQQGEKHALSCPEFGANNNKNAFCYVVESPVVLRCQLSQYQEQLDDLMNHIAAVADSSPVLNAPETNDICLAKYSADDGWYRGRIVNIDDGITVEFVDFGNQEKVDAQFIRSLSAEFAILPQTCVKVILNDVHLEDIDTAATITWLQEKVLEHVVRLEVVNVEEQATISAYVYIEGQDEHVNDKIYELHALQVTEEVVAVNENVVESSPPVQDTRTSSSPNTNVVAQTAVKTTPCKYKAHAINNNDTVPVICTFVSSATEIQVQLFQYTAQLDELMEKIASYCSQKTVTPNNLAVGTPYLGLYPDDGEWYRAEISDIDGKNITLKYIDYGNTAIVTAKDVRNITEEFLSLPRTCVTCKLHDVHVEDIDVKKSQEFLETYLNQELTLSVSTVENEQTISGFVSVPNGKVSLNDMLYEKFSLPEVLEAKETSAVPLSESATVVEQESKAQDDSMLANSEIVGEASILSKDHVVFLPSVVNSEEEVICTFVESPIKICCQLVRHESLFQAISALTEAPPADAKPVAHFAKGKAVIAKSEDDGAWYRAAILAKNESSVSVLYVDFGNKEEVPEANLIELYNDQLLAPPCCESIILQDVFQADLDCEKVMTWLNTECIDQPLRLETSKNEAGEYQAYVYFSGKRSEQSINDIIYAQFSSEDKVVEDDVIEEEDENGVNNGEPTIVCPESGLRQFPKPTVTAGTSENAICTVVDTPTVIRCQLGKYQKKLERLYNVISTQIETLSGMRFLEEGAPCLAQYVDLSWCRARILSASEATTRVEFVDFGNVDDVINEDFRVIRPEWVSDPEFCVKCILDGVHILPENEADVIEYLNRTLVDDAARVTLDIKKVDNEKDECHVILNQNGVDINDFLRKTYGPIECVYRERHVALGEKIKVTIPLTSTLSKFYCVFDDTKTEVDGMMADLNKVYSSAACPSPSDLQVDMPCCVRINNKWYRGEVTKISDHAEVLLVDYGLIESVPASDVRTLISSFFKLEMQAVCCSLFDLRPLKNTNTWSKEAVEYFNAVCDGEVLSATVVKYYDDMYYVALVLDNGDTIYELLTRENHAETKERRLSSPEALVLNGH